jgi:Zinc carboxypeptidase
VIRRSAICFILFATVASVGCDSEEYGDGHRPMSSRLSAQKSLAGAMDQRSHTFDDSDWYYYVRVPRSDVSALHAAMVGFQQDEVADDEFSFGYIPKDRLSLAPDWVIDRMVFLDVQTLRSIPFDPKTLTLHPEPPNPTLTTEGPHDSVTSYEGELNSLIARFPSYLQKYSIGSSVQGKSLWVVRASTTPNVTQERAVRLLYVANIHGDETVGREHMLKLIEVIGSCWSGSCYDLQGVDSTMAALINSLKGKAEITIMPVMNADGSLTSMPTRVNANGVDLNRNFPDIIAARQHGANNLPGTGYLWQRWADLMDPVADMTDSPLQPEVAAVIGVLSKTRLEAQTQPLPNPFVLSANFHAGSQIVNIPWDDQRSGTESSGVNAECANVQSLFGPSPAFPADMFVKGASREFANYSPDFRNENAGSASFYNGVTYGCEWYPFYDDSQTGTSGKGYEGGLQDFMNIYRSSNHVTIEQSYTKNPSWSTIMTRWVNQRVSLAAFLVRGLEGLHLHVVKANQASLLGAYVTVQWPYAVTGRPFAAVPRTIHYPNSSYIHIGAGIGALASASTGDLAHSGYNDKDEPHHMGYLNGAGQGYDSSGAMSVTVCVPGYAKSTLTVPPSVYNGTDFWTFAMTAQPGVSCP